MLAVDTNVVVRLIVADDARQAARARTLFERHTVFVADTVLLETEWVLRSCYGLPSKAVHTHLTALAGLPQVRLQAPQRAAKALEWYGVGLDFADALHMAACNEGVTFATFDRRLGKAATKAGIDDIELL
jgi:predicted nucleic-acid-binding protein